MQPVPSTGMQRQVSVQLADVDISGADVPGDVFSLADIQATLPQLATGITSWSSTMETAFGAQNLADDILSDSDGPGGCEKKSDTQMQKQTKAHTKRTPSQQGLHNLKDFKRQSKRKVADAQKEANSTTFNGISWATIINPGTRNAHLQSSQAPTQLTTWDDDQPRRAQSEDGVALLYSFPGLIGDKSKAVLNKTLISFGSSVPLSTKGGADDKGRNAQDSYHFRPKELTGIVKLVSAWHAVGHTHEKMVISSDWVKSADRFGKSAMLVDELTVLSHRINALYRAIDPTQYDALVNINARLEKFYPHLKALAAIDPCVFEGRAIMFNRRTPVHRDSKDPLKGWAILVVLGDFTQGYLFIPRLNLRLRYRPGDVVALRGRILEHEVEMWVGGQRISIAHFTHQSKWDEAGEEYP